MICPDCGGEVEQVHASEGGCIEETIITPGGLRRKVRPATFYACGGCEWCSETKPPEQEGPRDDGEAWAGGFADNH